MRTAAATSLAIAMVGLLAPVRADEAILSDGRKVAGKLVFKDGGWNFSPGDSSVRAAGAFLHRVRFEPPARPPLQAGLIVRVELTGGQRLTGRLVEFGTPWVKLQSVWAGDVAVQRTAVLAVTQVAGRLPEFLEDFESDLKSWQSRGNPALDRQATSGDKGLTLATAGQSVEHTLSKPISEGWAGINFRPEGEPAGATWSAEATFQTRTGPRRLLVNLAGDGEEYTVSAVGFAGTAVRVPRKSEWRRLSLRFTLTSLRVNVDDSVVWYSLENGSGGPLAGFKLSCTAMAPRTLRGAVQFDECAIYQADVPPRRPAGDPKQDEIWLATDDQAFGAIDRLDTAGVRLAGRSARVLPWTVVRGVYPSRQNVALPERPREAVRLEFDAGVDAEPDVIDGVVTRFDDKLTTIRNSLLDGDRTVDRNRLRSVQWFQR